MNQDRIGVFICNYNKKQYILDNLRSFSKQTIKEQLDIHVIDNASTDGAADAVEAEYPSVTVVRNRENLGGAGGFCQALKMGEGQGYEYLLLADNDIILAPDAVEQMYRFLKSNADVGMAGAKVYLMDAPDRIWIYGNWIDFENYRMIDGCSNETDNAAQPEAVYCDTVPACCSLIRTACLKKAGYMPESNFISWDDIEWCYRFGLAGYRVAAIAAARVWHKTSGSVLTAHFSTYYYNRNKLNFFARYIAEDKIEHFADKILADYFTRIYGLAQKGAVNHVASLMCAFTDFLFLVRGKAEERKILPYDKVDNQLVAAVGDAPCIRVVCPCEPEGRDKDAIGRALHNVLRILEGRDTAVVLQGSREEDPGGVQVRLCSHVRHVDGYRQGEIYVDEWCNVIRDEMDYHYFRDFEYAERNFRMMYHRLLIDSVWKIRDGMKGIENAEQ